MSSDPQAPETTGRQERRARRGGGAPSWAIGGVLVVVGIVYLVRNVTGVELGNWWALFILIPAIGSLVTAYRMWERNDRRFTAASRGPLIGGIILLGVTAVFLFSLDWGKVWPLFIILVGIGALLSAFERKT
jgi:hypothetical protein